MRLGFLESSLSRDWIKQWITLSLEKSQKEAFSRTNKRGGEGEKKNAMGGEKLKREWKYFTQFVIENKMYFQHGV